MINCRVVPVAPVCQEVQEIAGSQANQGMMEPLARMALTVLTASEGYRETLE